MENNKWDLTYIFKTDELWNESFDEAKELIKDIKPDYVHIVYKGRIVKTGDDSLVDRVEKEGFTWIKEELK